MLRITYELNKPTFRIRYSTVDSGKKLGKLSQSSENEMGTTTQSEDATNNQFNSRTNSEKNNKTTNIDKL